MMTEETGVTDRGHEQDLRETVHRLMTPEQVTAAAGGEIAYSLRITDPTRDTTRSELWMLRPGESPIKLIADAECTAPAFSPDGSRIAFLKSDGSKSQVCLLPLSGGEPDQLTSLPGGAGHPVWSPDGRSIAFSAPVDRRSPDAGERGSSQAPIVIDRLGFKEDGRGFTGTVRAHLHVLDVDTGEVRQVTDGDWEANQPAWSPDSSHLAFSARMAERGDINLTSAAYIVDLGDHGATPQTVGPEHGVMGAITWTPDGASLVVVGSLGPINGPQGLLKIALDGSGVTDLAAPLQRNVMAGAPAYPGAFPQVTNRGTVIFCARDRGYTNLYEVDLAGGTPRRLPTIPSSNVRGASVSAQADRVAVIIDSPSTFAEIAIVELADESVRVLTAHNPRVDELGFLVREERDFTISDGVTVSGWVLRANDASSPGPVLLDIHGGPHNAWNGAVDDVHLYHQVLARRGWTILTVNPRGSDGYGQSFFNAIDGAWGVGDSADLLEPIDQLVEAGIADPARLALAGYSYGGYLTCYLTSRDHRFAAAVAGGTISDMTSMVGASAEGRFLHFELGSDPWDDRDTFPMVSPYAQVSQVQTPTLLVHGADDLVCPLGQAELWFSALRTRGVPTQLVVYPNGSHLFPIDGPPSHRIDYNQRIVDCLTQFVTAEQGAS